MSRSWGSRVLVTGATGFLGGHVISALCARDISPGSSGDAVRALVRSAGARLHAGVKEVVAALDDDAALRRALEGVSTVIHLAAHVHHVGDPRDEAAYRAVNLNGTVALLEAGVSAGIRDFVFVSTVKAVGETSATPWTEQTPAAPMDAYGRTKLAAEQAVRDAARRHAIHAPILRLPLVYGPGMKANALKLFDLVDRGVPLPLGRVHNRRSVLYVGNFVATVFSVLEQAAGDDLFFVSDGPAISTPALIEAIARALGKPARLVPVPVGLMRLAASAGDRLARILPWPLTTAKLERMIDSLAVDSSKLTALAGPMPFTLEQGLARTAEWYRRRAAA